MYSEFCVRHASGPLETQCPGSHLSIIMAFSDDEVLFIETANSLTSYTFNTYLQCFAVCISTEKMDIRGTRHWSIPDWEFLSKMYLTRKREKQKEEIEINQNQSIIWGAVALNKFLV